MRKLTNLKGSADGQREEERFHTETDGLEDVEKTRRRPIGTTLNIIFTLRTFVLDPASAGYSTVVES